jgi:general secretion pathway protein K
MPVPHNNLHNPNNVLRDRSGMALVLTLLAVSFLVAVTVQLSTSVSWQMQAAANQSGIVQLDAMLLSGLNLARAALLTDQQENDYDSAFDSWGAFDTEAIAGLFPGDLRIKITDLSGRLQVNTLVLTEKEKKAWKKEWKKKNKGGKKKKDPEKIQRDLWKRFLLLEASGMGGNNEENDEEQVTAMLDSLIDWLDEDDEEQENGAENGYYSGLEPPYAPANGPVSFIEELQFVKGWDKELLYGNQDGKRNRDAQEERDDEQSEQSGIIAYLATGDHEGKVNINTAPARVLQALDEEMTEELAADLVAFRREEENKELLAESTWYRQVAEFPGDIVFDKDLITTDSSYFKITVTGDINGLRRTGEGIIHRRENQEQVLLCWKVE